MEIYQFTKKRQKANFDGNIVRGFLEARYVRIPKELFDALSTSEFNIKGKELCALQYDLVNRICSNGKKRWRRIYHKLFSFGTSMDITSRCKEWLREHSFINAGKSFSNSKTKPQSKRYKFEIYPSGVYVYLNELIKRNDPFTENEANCLYSREMLDLLQFDFGKLCSAVERELRGKKQESQYRWLQKHANRLVDLIHKCGSVRRSRQVGRLYTPFTNLKKSYRQFFSFDGEEMVNLDMCSAHPTLLANLSGDERLLEDCLMDKFYENMPSFAAKGRDSAKEEYYQFAYGPVNESLQSYQAMLKFYPVATKFMRENKKPFYENFSHMMQRQESDLWIDQIYGEIRRRGIKALTIHDSVFTGKSNKEIVQEIIEDVMKKKELRMKLKIEQPLFARVA